MLLRKIKTKNLIAKAKPGFSILELLLAMGIISVVMVGAMSYFKSQAEATRAKTAGEQIKDVGTGFNIYLSKMQTHFGTCMTIGQTIKIPNGAEVISNSNGTFTVSGTNCQNIPYMDTMSTTTVPSNVLGFDYDLYVRKNNSGKIEGLVLSNRPVMSSDNSTPRYDWLGMAVTAAGANGGMTTNYGKNATNANDFALRGYGGGWTLTNQEFKNTPLNKGGYLGYRVNFAGPTDDIYLRLDGLYPMQGDLDMGNHNINNATDINFNGWLTGNNVLVNNIKSGYINNDGAIDTDTLRARKAIATGNHFDNPVPAEMVDSDYIHTSNVYAENKIATGKNGVINGSLNADGLLDVKNMILRYPGCGDSKNLSGADCLNPWSGHITERLPRFVMVGSGLVANGAQVIKPACRGTGSLGNKGDHYENARIMLIPQVSSIYSPFAVAYKYNGNNAGDHWQMRFPKVLPEQIKAYAINESATTWRVYLKSANSTGQWGEYDNEYVALAQIYCDFGS